ncbi:hypothetical protein CDV50_05785 [Haematobacter massiliensis]|uniref:Uncharacterized protein n=1 Tax=Haematobacter massiliensis TaxID=195105 RepID=A0A086YD86_9RHOB|nr:hypothetical protein CN97_06530 [Haematobacter massiliensis]OWJ72665.1 hypothetical protein CDV50_05785 [Haematobacter massiliensis]OWJ86804.1 hypothetical protein CDV51_09760 [Haematobacter massiliensis]
MSMITQVWDMCRSAGEFDMKPTALGMAVSIRVQGVADPCRLPWRRGTGSFSRAEREHAVFDGVVAQFQHIITDGWGRKRSMRTRAGRMAAASRYLPQGRGASQTSLYP